MMLYEGRLSLICFLLPTPVLTVYLFSFLGLEYLYNSFSTVIWLIFISYIIFINIILYILTDGYMYEVAVRAAFLGSVFTAGILIIQYLYAPWTVFGIYMCVMAFFHYSEFLTIAVTNPRTLSIDSFILNHSTEYTVAAITSWLEFIVEVYFFQEWKQELWAVSCVGMLLCVGGECLRKLAMLTAQHNFNHVVQSVRSEDHRLVTQGVYSLCRHPSYVGWFYWSMGTQMILVNPFCLVAYILASWKFFNDRITVEEITLLNFFGKQYIDYQEQVGTGLPLIHGYRLKP